MMENIENEIKRLKFEDFIAVLFIVTSAINIYANTLHIEYLNTNNQEKERIARDLYLLVTIITIAVYYYFINRNYNFLKEAENKGQDTRLHFIRFVGSIFFMVGILLVFYVLVKSRDIEGEVEI